MRILSIYASSSNINSTMKDDSYSTVSKLKDEERESPWRLDWVSVMMDDALQVAGAWTDPLDASTVK